MAHIPFIITVFDHDIARVEVPKPTPNGQQNGLAALGHK